MSIQTFYQELFKADVQDIYFVVVFGELQLDSSSCLKTAAGYLSSNVGSGSELFPS